MRKVMMDMALLMIRRWGGVAGYRNRRACQRIGNTPVAVAAEHLGYGLIELAESLVELALTAWKPLSILEVAC
jgi:hypothetical protein